MMYMHVYVYYIYHIFACAYVYLHICVIVVTEVRNVGSVQVHTTHEAQDPPHTSNSTPTTSSSLSMGEEVRGKRK